MLAEGTTYWITFLSIYAIRCISPNRPSRKSDRANGHLKRNRRQSTQHTHTRAPHANSIDSAMQPRWLNRRGKRNIFAISRTKHTVPENCDRTRGMQIGEMIMSWINMFSISPTMGLSLVRCRDLVRPHVRGHGKNLDNFCDVLRVLAAHRPGALARWREFIRSNSSDSKPLPSPFVQPFLGGRSA